MKALSLLFLMVMANFAFGQEIRFRDNFFNNPVFFVEGEKVSRGSVSQLMKEYPIEKKDFDEGLNQMVIGTSLKVAAFGVLSGGLVYYLANIDEPNSWQVPLITSATALVLSQVGHSLRKKGYNRVNSSIYRYNYLISNEDNAKLSLVLTGGGPSLVYRF